MFLELEEIVLMPNMASAQTIRKSGGSSAGIVTDYGLDERGGIRVLVIKNSSLLSKVHIGTGIHRASYSMDTAGNFAGESNRDMKLITHL
jgi:hypothetical protein